MTMTNHKGALQSDTLRLPKANRPKAVCECKCEPSVAQKSIDHRESLTRVKPLLPRANSSALFSYLAFFLKVISIIMIWPFMYFAVHLYVHTSFVYLHHTRSLTRFFILLLGRRIVCWTHNS